ncbi:hypothetical protein [Psychroflexus aestuariivivens]|uniref:hypothetical protein n=1 Tax=Psychroflexus aestuariivivens TaxID=1795040 RepID=UPI000FDC1A0A|nr:hypothetical protein [Psychroflexus aestuariivivens]
MKLIFHIGLPKTGTSYLQSFLFHKYDDLRNHGIYFPLGEDSNKEKKSHFEESRSIINDLHNMTKNS